MKLVKLIANLGYGSRKEVTAMFREGRITDPQGEVLYADDKVPFDALAQAYAVKRLYSVALRVYLNGLREKGLLAPEHRCASVF